MSQTHLGQVPSNSLDLAKDCETSHPCWVLRWEVAEQTSWS